MVTSSEGGFVSVPFGLGWPEVHALEGLLQLLRDGVTASGARVALSVDGVLLLS